MIRQYRKKDCNTQRTSKVATLTCDCHCSDFEFEKCSWDDGEVWYEFSFKSSYLNKKLPNVFKRIGNAIRNKPYCFASIVIENKDEVIEFLNDCNAIVRGEEDEID